jgi:hypothetical protein
MKSNDLPNAIVVELKCGHGDILLQSIKKIGDKYWCKICEDNSIVVEIDGIWVWRCTQCKASRSFGVIRHQADKSGTGHAQLHGHVVELRRRGFPETVTKIKPENDVEELPF